MGRPGGMKGREIWRVVLVHDILTRPSGNESIQASDVRGTQGFGQRTIKRCGYDFPDAG